MKIIGLDFGTNSHTGDLDYIQTHDKNRRDNHGSESPASLKKLIEKRHIAIIGK